MTDGERFERETQLGFSEKQDRMLQQDVAKQLAAIAEGGSVQLALELAWLHGAQFVLADSLETMQREYYQQ
jgi:hypothetical protein